MFLPDEQYATLVGFIEGFNAATGWKFLEGFNEWTQKRLLGHETSVYWAAVVWEVSTQSGQSATDRPSRENEEHASDILLTELEAFLRSKG